MKTNKSMAWAVLSASAPAVLFVAASKAVGISVNASSLLFPAGALCAGTAITIAAHDYISKDPARRFKVTCENTGIFIKRDAGIRLPVLRGRERLPAGWRLYYKLPIGLAKSDLDNKQEQIEAALDAEVSFMWRGGLVQVDILQGVIPGEVAFEQLERMAGEIPFTVGYGREGLITADLASFPHLLVAGQTGGGKSVFLAQMIESFPAHIMLFVIDLKEVEFAYLEEVARVEYDLDGSISVLEMLTAEMNRRKKLLKKAGVRSAKDYRKAHDLPYWVLVVDEFSQLCPHLAKDKAEREAKNYTHKMLVDLLSLARSLGIHVVISTQYPHSDILPGTLKQNIPATVAFKVRTEAGSRVCLDNSRAAGLPTIPGRAIFQYKTEREVQVMFFSPERFINDQKNTSSSSCSSASSVHWGYFNDTDIEQEGNND